MSDTYTKLFRSITASTIVSEPLATRWLWVTMLSQADASGCVWGSVPGLARLANISMEECEAALECFLSPDFHSRTKDNEGRRIEVIPRGWKLLNHAVYASIRGAEERAEYKRQWDRDHRGDRPNAAHRTPDSPRQPPTESDSNRQTPIPPAPLALSPASIKHAQSSARFGEFWAAYPVRKGKKEALTKWRAMGLDAIADQILSDVKERSLSDRGWLDGYVPHGSTYVNKKVWEDDIDRRKPKASSKAESAESEVNDIFRGAI